MLKRRKSDKLLALLLTMAVIISTCLLPDSFVKASEIMPVLNNADVYAQDGQITESTNVLLGKRPTTNAVNSQRLEKATDGNNRDLDGNGTGVTELISGEDESLGVASAASVYLQYDLGVQKVLEKIKIYRFIYANDYCKYYSVKVMLSNDPTFADPAQTVTVFGAENGTDIADRAPDGANDVFSDIPERVTKGKPQEIFLNLTQGYQYIRFISKGHAGSWASNGYSNKVRYAELEAYAQEPVSDTVDVNILEYMLPQKWDGALMDLNSGGTVGQKVTILNSELATDGDKAQENTNGDQEFTTLSAGEGSDDGQIPEGNVENYIQYEFKDERPIKKVEIYRDTYAGNSNYAGRICTFKQVKVALSMDEDFTNPTYVYGTADAGRDYQETTSNRGEPQVIDLSGAPVTAKYIRIYGKGAFHDNQKGWSHYFGENNYAEIRALSEYKRDELPPENGTELNIGFKEPYGYGKGLKDANLINDGNLDTYAENLSTGKGAWINFDYANRYRITKVKFKLENDTYPSVKVMLSGNPYFTTYETIFEESNFDYANAASGSAGDNAEWTYDSLTQSITITLKEPTGAQHIRFAIDRGANQAKIGEVEIYAMLPDGTTLEEIKTKEQRVDYNPEADYIPSYSQYNKLAWSDEFNGDAVDETKWNIIDGMQNHGAIYNRGAVSVKDGNLVINTKNYDTYDNLVKNVGIDVYEDENPDKNKVTWSSGRVETKNKYSFQYGRVAVRAKVNDSKGVWPAIWMLCQDETGHDEIDILEYLGHDGSGDGLYYAWTTNHFGVYKVNKGSDGTATLGYEPWSQAYHVYEVEWSPEQIQFYIDGKLVKTTTAGKDDRDAMHTRAMFAILETQIGDSWVGPVDYAKNLTKQDSNYLIDWIRVYQKSDSDVIYFDDCASAEDNDNSNYTIVPKSTSGEDTLLRMTDGTTQPEKKNNFIYGGQPRYENSRLAANQPGAYLVYQVPELKDAHLTAYYQTIEGASIGSGGNVQGVSIRDKMVDNADLDFKMYISETGEEESWKELVQGENCTKLQAFKNCVEQYPLFGRITFDAYGLPEGTNYIKIVFPDITGKKYLDNSGNEKAVEKTDIQLAKVTFNQKNLNASDTVTREMLQQQLQTAKEKVIDLSYTLNSVNGLNQKINEAEILLQQDSIQQADLERVFIDLETAYHALEKITVTITASSGGKAEKDKVEYKRGETITFTATPESGYNFVNWKDEAGNIVSQNVAYAVEIQNSLTLTANFEKESYEPSDAGNSNNSTNSGKNEKPDQTTTTDGDKKVTTTIIKDTDKNVELKITETSTEKAGITDIKISVSSSKPEVQKTDTKTQVSMQLPEKTLNELVGKLADGQKAEVEINVPKETILEQIKESTIKTLEFSLVVPNAVTETQKISFSKINLDKEILEIAKKDGKDFMFSVTDEKGKDNYTWSFKGQTLKASKNKIENIDMALQVVPVKTTSQVKIQNLIKEDKNNENGLVIELKHSGLLPDTGYIKMQVGNYEEVKPNSTVYLYYFNEKTNKLDTVPDNKYTIDKDGYVTIKLIHCSNYVLVPEKVSDVVATSLLEQVKVSPNKKTLKKNATKKIKVSFPETIQSSSDSFVADGVAVAEVTYQSKNKKIASVSKKGKIKAKKKGNTKIITTLKLTDGQKQKFKTTIKVK